MIGQSCTVTIPTAHIRSFRNILSYPLQITLPPSLPPHFLVSLFVTNGSPFFPSPSYFFVFLFSNLSQSTTPMLSLFLSFLLFFFHFLHMKCFFFSSLLSLSSLTFSFFCNLPACFLLSLSLFFSFSFYLSSLFSLSLSLSLFLSTVLGL